MLNINNDKHKHKTVYTICNMMLTYSLINLFVVNLTEHIPLCL
jgi:hypothetical protein